MDWEQFLAMGGMLLKEADGAGGDLGGGAGDQGAEKALDNPEIKNTPEKKPSSNKEGDDPDAEKRKKEKELADKAKDDALAKAQKELDELRKERDKFKGIDPEKARKLEADEKEREEKELEAKGEYDRLKQRMADQHANEVKAKDDVIKNLQEQLNIRDSQIDELTIGSNFNTSQYIKEELVLTPSKARALYGKNFERDEQGNLIAYDKPAGSKDRTPLVDASGKPLNFEGAIKTIIESDPEKDSLLRGKLKGGAGSGNANQSGKEIPSVKAFSSDDVFAKGIQEVLDGAK